ncbi:MAG: ribonuclease HII [Coprobacillaceae bacterium]
MGKTRIEYEQKYYQEGYRYIIGLDEAGRGPMAGELVVAGVVFPKDFYHQDIYDSKQLSAKKREILYSLIISEALYYHIEIVSIDDVDKLNVYQASKMAMEKCAKALWKEGMFALTDAMPLTDIPHLSIIKGDDASMSIAAASILAKVTRDHLMEEYAKQYPEYGFEKHKGYVTKMHKEALQKYGVCSIHRRSFKPVQQKLEEQMTLKL